MPSAYRRGRVLWTQLGGLGWRQRNEGGSLLGPFEGGCLCEERWGPTCSHLHGVAQGQQASFSTCQGPQGSGCWTCPRPLRAPEAEPSPPDERGQSGRLAGAVGGGVPPTHWALAPVARSPDPPHPLAHATCFPSVRSVPPPAEWNSLICTLLSPEERRFPLLCCPIFFSSSSS